MTKSIVATTTYPTIVFRRTAFLSFALCATTSFAQVLSPAKPFAAQEAASFQRVVTELRNTVTYLRQQSHDFGGQRNHVIQQSEEAIASLEKLLAMSKPVLPPPARPTPTTAPLPPAPTSVRTGSAPVTPGSVTTPPANLQGMDLQTAMMAVQSERANLLEGQLKAQMSAVQERNKQIADLNSALKALTALRPAGDDMNAWINLGKTRDEGRTLLLSLTQSGVLPINGMPAIDEQGGNGIYDIQRRWLETLVQNIKANIDSLNSSQQMDMLRLQSLSNKRNEAFEVMTNFIKKMQDSRSSIIGNMR